MLGDDVPHSGGVDPSGSENMEIQTHPHPLHTHTPMTQSPSRTPGAGNIRVRVGDLERIIQVPGCVDGEGLDVMPRSISKLVGSKI